MKEAWSTSFFSHDNYMQTIQSYNLPKFNTSEMEGPFVDEVAEAPDKISSEYVPFPLIYHSFLLANS